MTVSPDNLIEKFANMLEEGETLDLSAFADKAIEIIAMISVASDLGDTLQKINSTLYSLLQNANDVYKETGTNAKASAANEIRALKQSTRCEVLH